MIFLAGRDYYIWRTLLRGVHDRLTRQAECEDVRYHPPRRRSRYVTADVNPTTFPSNSYDAEAVRLGARFWYLAGVDYEYYHVNWVEPDRDPMLGFHQDTDHPDPGPCHIQPNYGDTPVDRHGATLLDAHPLAILDDRLQQLLTVVEAIH